MPGNTPSQVFFYTYVLQSLQDNTRYIGYTKDLKKRLEEHQKGYSAYTKSKRPLRLIYYEACLNMKDAKRRENYFKTPAGRRALALRLLEFKRQNAFGLGRR